jgi:hypothetical protein
MHGLIDVIVLLDDSMILSFNSSVVGIRTVGSVTLMFTFYQKTGPKGPSHRLLTRRFISLKLGTYTNTQTKSLLDSFTGSSLCSSKRAPTVRTAATPRDMLDAITSLSAPDTARVTPAHMAA